MTGTDSVPVLQSMVQGSLKMLEKKSLYSVFLRPRAGCLRQNQNIPRNEESVSYFERKNRSFLVVLNNGVTRDSNLKLSPHD